MKQKSKTRNNKKRIVVIGGGTGTYTVLSGLKKYPVSLTAIVTMADDGGSTGQLRDELGVLPPGDVRQCLVALSRSDLLMRELMNYRFLRGSLKGHSFGNILLSALEKVTGSFDVAVERASDILRTAGKVIPATLVKTRLVASLAGGRILHGEHVIDTGNLKKMLKLELRPKAVVNPKAVRAILEADVVVIGPGNVYSSLVPNFLVRGLGAAVCKSRAKKIFVCNLMTKAGHTDAWQVEDFANTIERYLGCSFDSVIYNRKAPSASLVKKYAQKGERVVRARGKLPKKYVGADLISKKFPMPRKGDSMKRSFIRHDPDKLARLIVGQLTI